MSPHQRPRRIVYASEGMTTHDRRFLAVLTKRFRHVLHLRLDGYANPPEQVTGPLKHAPWSTARVELSEPMANLTSQGLAREVAAFEPNLLCGGPIPRVGLPLATVGTELKVPVVQISWGSDLLRDIQMDPHLREQARNAIEASTGVLVDCMAAKDVSLELGADEEQVWQMPWGVDLAAHRYTPPPCGPIRFLSLRSLEPLYDQATILRAYADSRRTAAEAPLLTIAGDGTQLDSLKRLAASLGVASSVDWLGRVPEEQVPFLLTSHHLHISAARSDGSSVSLLQALACGRPSAVADIPSNREWITPGVNGFIFPTGDYHRLAEILRQAASGEVDLEVMGRTARATAEERADWAANSTLWVEWLDQLASDT